MTETHKPIPVPLDRRWREFRIRYLPIVVFVAVSGVVAFLWQEHVTPTQAVGMGVAEQYHLRSPRDGVVQALDKERFDLIEADEVVVALHPAHTERIQAQLEVIRAEVELIRAGLDPAVGQHRNRINYEELRLDMMNARIQLASDRLQRDFLQREVERKEHLYDQHLISAAEYDRLTTELATQKLRIQEGEIVLTDLGERLQELAKLWTHDDPYETAIQAAISVKEKELLVLETELTPLRLAAPAGGIISEVLRKNGEFVTAGESILQIREQTLGYVVGYIRQPLTQIPELGAAVQVVSKSRNVAYDGMITQIGYQLEPIHEALLRPGMNVEYVLPIRIQVDAEAAILPGEILDIRL